MSILNFIKSENRRRKTILCDESSMKIFVSIKTRHVIVNIKITSEKIRSTNTNKFYVWILRFPIVIHAFFSQEPCYILHRRIAPCPWTEPVVVPSGSEIETSRSKCFLCSCCWHGAWAPPLPWRSSPCVWASSRCSSAEFNGTGLYSLLLDRDMRVVLLDLMSQSRTPWHIFTAVKTLQALFPRFSDAIDCKTHFPSAFSCQWSSLTKVPPKYTWSPTRQGVATLKTTIRVFGNKFKSTRH